MYLKDYQQDTSNLLITFRHTLLTFGLQVSYKQVFKFN
jgi:hypothetical protein